MTTPSLDAVRALADKVAGLEREVRAVKRSANLGRAAIDSGALTVTGNDGEDVLRIGMAEGGAAAVEYVAGPTPGTPSAPIVTPVVGALVITWDGRLFDADGAVVGAPADHQHVCVYVTQDVTEGEEDPFDRETATLTTVITNAAGGSATVGLDYGRYEVRLVAMSRAGQFSEPSEVVEADVEMLVSAPDLAPVLGDLDDRLATAGDELAASAARLAEAEADIAASQIDIARASKLYTASVMAPTVADGAERAVDSWWVQINAAGTQLGSWRWSGTAWQATPLSPTVIPLLDAGKISTGVLAAERIISNALAVGLAQILELDVGKLVASSATISEAVAIKLFAGIFTANKITAAQIDAASLRAAILIAQSIDAGMIKAGAITVNHLNVGDRQNLVIDSDYAAPAAWTNLYAGPGSGWSTDFTYGTAKAVVKLTQHAAAQATQSIYAYNHAPSFRTQRVVPGEVYRVSTVIRADGAVGNMSSVGMRCYFFDEAGTQLAGAAGNVAAGASLFPSTWPGANVWVTVGGQVTVPDGAFYVTYRPTVYYPNNTTPVNSTTWYVGPITCYRAADATLVVDGSIDGRTITGALIQTHKDAEKGIKLDSTALRVWGPDGGDPVAEIRADGGTTYSVTDPVTGDVLAALLSDGGVAGTSLAISGEARIDGAVVIGADPLSTAHGSGDYGPTINGRDLLGDQVMDRMVAHPATDDSTAWMTLLPHGMVARGVRDISGLTVTDQERELLELSYDNYSGRAYKISVSPFALYVGAGAYAYLNIYAEYGTRPTMGSTLLHRQALRNQNASAIMMNLGGEFYDLSAGSGRRRYLLTFHSTGGQATIFGSASGGYLRAWVEDIGLPADDTGVDRTGVRSTGGSAPAAPALPKPDPVKTYTTTLSASWWQGYRGSGAYAPSQYDGKVTQGYSAYAPSNGTMRGMIGFPSLASTLSGATVKKIEVYVYASHWYANSGGTLCIGTHGAASKPSTWESVSNDVKRQGLKKPEGRWITLPSSVHAGFKAGTLRGITAYPPSGSTSSAYYGYLTGSRSKIRVTYTK